MMVRAVALLLALVLLPTTVLAQKSITTGSITPNAPPVVVITVTGATGDGNTSLKDALTEELSGAYRVEGAVALSPAKDGKQSIHIEWTVRDPSGKKIGTVSQRNEIPAGALDGKWGVTAKAAAGEAAWGIAKLIPPP
jgi:nucleoside-triphosphatase THEP1